MSMCDHGYELYDGLGDACLTCHQDEVERLRKVEAQAKASLSDRMDELAELRMQTERLQARLTDAVPMSRTGSLPEENR